MHLDLGRFKSKCLIYKIATKQVSCDTDSLGPKNRLFHVVLVSKKDGELVPWATSAGGEEIHTNVVLKSLIIIT